MSRFDPPALENHLQGKVVVLTGMCISLCILPPILCFLILTMEQY